MTKYTVTNSCELFVEIETVRLITILILMKMKTNYKFIVINLLSRGGDMSSLITIGRVSQNQL